MAAIGTESRADLSRRPTDRKRPLPAAIEILATPSLIALVNHIKGASVLAPPVAEAGAKRRAPRPTCAT